MQRFILRHNRAPGDITAMTALVRDIALTHPGKYQVAVDTSFRDLWANNPHIIPLSEAAKGATVVKLSYGEYITLAGRQPIHFLESFHRDFAKKTGIKVPLVRPTPDLHMTGAERATRHVEGKYWVVLAGGKLDFTTKHYVYKRHQEVVHALRGMGLGVVQLGARGQNPTHFHPKLDSTLDLIGRTSLREMLQIVANADGVICTITFAMHAAAALGRPCVVTAGGREEWWWEAYHRDNPGLGANRHELPVDHRYLHTLGRLDCCLRKGCWKNKVLANERDKSFCAYPKQSDGGQVVPLCMDMISADRIVESVLSYYLDGTLTPPEGMMLPTADQPTTVNTPDGRRLVVTVRNDGLVPLPVVQPPPPVLATPLAVPAPQPAKAPVAVGPAVDAPEVGGRFTFFVLCYGDYPDMHRRCLKGIEGTTQSRHVDLRVYLNAAHPDTVALAEEMQRNGRVQVLYKSAENKRKYPAMREMFHDPNHPIQTPWVVWFDDDTMCDVDPQWFDKMTTALHHTAVKDSRVGMLGSRYFFKMAPKHADWVRKAPWYTGRAFRDKAGAETPNGDKIHFGTGSFWVLRTDLIKRCDIPDPRITHNGGDICVGEQIWQQGYNLKHWNGDKKTVLWSSKPRRGLSESIFGI